VGLATINSRFDTIMSRLTLTEENYLKAVLQISLKSNLEWVSTGKLAAELRVSPGTVTSMLQSLAKAKTSGETKRPSLVNYKPYEGVRLTRDGRKLALQMLRRHRLIELFLVNTLKLTWDRVHEEAENMEHAVSDFLIDRIDDFMGRPAFDPHGDPIPTAEGEMRVQRESAVPLATCQPGARVRFVRVVNQGSDFLRFLSESGFELQAVGVVEENNPEAGIVMTRVGGRSVSMGYSAAESLLVEKTTGQE